MPMTLFRCKTPNSLNYFMLMPFYNTDLSCLAPVNLANGILSFAPFAGDFVPCSFTTCFPPKEGCRALQLKCFSSMPLLLQLSIKLALLRSVSTLKHYERSAKVCMLHPMSEPVKSNSDTHDTPCDVMSRKVV